MSEIRERIHPGAFCLTFGSDSFDTEELGTGHYLQAGALMSRVLSGPDAGKLVPFDPAGEAGEDRPIGILFGGADTRTYPRPVTMLVRNAAINAKNLAWPDGMSVEEKSVALGHLVEPAEETHLAVRGIPVTAPVEPEAPEEPSYVGPLDLVPGAVVAYGVRALSAAMLGQNIFRLRRDSDNVESNFAADAVTGDAPGASIATWLGAANGFLVTLYDQSGNGKHATQATSGNQPAWVASALNTKPACDFEDGKSLVTADNVTYPNGALTIFCVGKGNLQLHARTGGGPNVDFFIGFNAFVDQANGSDEAYCDFDASGIDDTVYRLWMSAWTINSYLMTADDISLDPDPFTSGTSIASIDAQTSLMDGGSNSAGAELIVYPEIFSGANISAVSANQNTYFGL